MSTKSNKPEEKPAEASVAKNDIANIKDDNKKTDAVKKTGPKKPDARNTDVKPDASKETRSKKPARRSTKTNPLSKTALLALLLVLGVGTVAGYEFFLLQNQTTQITELSQSQQSLLNRIEKQEQELERARQRLTAENETLKNTMNTVSAQLGRTTIAWRLAEVEYLLTVANHRLNLVQDRVTAIAVFETADERILAIGDPGLLSVRQSIANELNQLRSLSEPDLTGMALSLSSLARDVDKMPLVFKERVALATGEKQKAKPDNWRQIPAAMWEEIKGLVVIRRHQQPTEPLLPPTEAWFLHQNLRLKLEQAQLALLRRDTNLFRKNLEDASAWIQTFFDSDSATVKNASSIVDTLARVELKLDIPDVSGSLRELRRVLKQRGVAMNKDE